MNTRAISFSIAILFLSLMYGELCHSSLAQSPTADPEADRRELDLYRSYMPKLVNSLKSCNQTAGDRGISDLAYENYLSRFWQQAVEFRDIRLELYRWQVLSGNTILFLVLLMSIGGFSITVFQIYQLYKLNQIERETSFHVSLKEMKITTSLTGIAVLAISFSFLVVYLSQVHTIRRDSFSKPDITIDSGSK